MDELPDFLTSAPSPIFSADAEMSWECELGPSASKLFGIDFANGPDVTCSSVIFKTPRKTQIRRHKKKRINKKWNKKFGPRYILTFKAYQLQDVQFTQNDSELTIVGERPRIFTPNDPLYI